MARVGSEYGLDRLRICSEYDRHMPRISSEYDQNMLSIFQEYDGFQALTTFIPIQIILITLPG